MLLPVEQNNLKFFFGLDSTLEAFDDLEGLKLYFFVRNTQMGEMLLLLLIPKGVMSYTAAIFKIVWSRSLFCSHASITDNQGDDRSKKKLV